MGSRAITTLHHLTTVPLARLGTDEVGGGLFLAVCTVESVKASALPSKNGRTKTFGGGGGGGGSNSELPQAGFPESGEVPSINNKELHSPPTRVEDLNSHSGPNLILAGHVLFFALNRARVRLGQGVRRVL